VLQTPLLSPANQEIVRQVSTLAREKFSGRASRYDEESSFPVENYQDLHQAGLLALTVPQEYGGLGVDAVTFSLCILEMAKGCPATALTFNMHANVIGTFLENLATPEQKQRYFGEVVEKGRLFASITSEPDSSFRDRFVLRTTFVPVDQGYRIQGTKHFCSLGDAADYYFVSGLLEGSTSARDGLVSAMIPRSESGIRVEGRWNAAGMRGTTSHTIRYDAVVGHSEIIGAPGQLLTVGLSGFALGYAATYLGVAEAALEFIIQYARNRVLPPATDPISHHPLTQRTIGEMATSVKAARLLLLDAAQAKDAGNPEATTLAVNQAKYYAAEVAMSVTEKAMRLAGGSGILKSYPLERWHRDALAGPVMPPSNDRCLETIGRILCGLRAATLEFQ
jgi:hypothetical protein